MLNRKSTVLMTVAILGAAAPVFADCVYTVRPANAEEKKIHADGFALFQRIAPPTPAGWQPVDNPKDGDLKEVCAPSAASVTRWGFYRGFDRVEGVQERQAQALDQVRAAAERSKAAMKANEAKLAENQRQFDAVMKKMQTLMVEKKTAGLEALQKEAEQLMKERQKLMGGEGQDGEMKAIDAAVRKDTIASFGMVIGETAVNTDGFKPMAVPVGKGYRRESESGGNPQVDIVVVLPPAAGTKGQTVVRISGDPARADALLKAANFR
jgi:hypothetical protein